MAPPRVIVSDASDDSVHQPLNPDVKINGLGTSLPAIRPNGWRAFALACVAGCGNRMSYETCFMKSMFDMSPEKLRTVGRPDW